jgi:outer membrane protein
MKIRHTIYAGCIALLGLGSSAYAQRAGDNILSVGVVNMSPQVTLGALNSVGPAAATFNAQTAGAEASSSSVNTLSLSYLHMFTDHIATEISIGVPPKLTLDVHLKGSDHPGAATAEVLTPALVAKYLFNTPADKFRPYLGLGATYTTFRNVNANTSDPVINALGGTSTSLSEGWAPIYNIGLIYHITDRLSLNALISYIPLKPTATLIGSGTTTTGNIEINPTDYVLRLGYKF